MPSVIIMAGGVGERFWPVSRKDLPKQFLKLYKEKTLLEYSYERAKKIVTVDKIYIATTENFKDKVKELIPEIPNENIIAEPIGRNTAPCLGYGVMLLLEQNGDDIVAVLPSDHIILDENSFIKEMFNAFDFLSKKEGIITFGIKPKRPETNYGYILKGEKTLPDFPYKIYKAIKFVEKPNLSKASEYVQSEKYLWNSGMFVFKASFFIDKFKICLPQIYDGIKNVLLKTKDPEEIKRTYEAFPKISIDYGVMENISEIYTLEVDIGWDDLGNWLSFENIYDTDAFGNILIKGDFVGIDTNDSIIYSEDGLVATIGVKDLIIASSRNAILICHKDKIQDIRSIVSKLEGEKLKKYK